MDGLSERAGCDAKQMQPIETAVDGIHRELEQLGDCVTTLHDRLSSVMVSEASFCEEKEAEVKLPEMSPLLVSIKEACRSINSERHKLSNLLTRLQI